MEKGQCLITKVVARTHPFSLGQTCCEGWVVFPKCWKVTPRTQLFIIQLSKTSSSHSALMGIGCVFFVFGLFVFLSDELVLWSLPCTVCKAITSLYLTYNSAQHSCGRGPCACARTSFSCDLSFLDLSPGTLEHSAHM